MKRSWSANIIKLMMPAALAAACSALLAPVPVNGLARDAGAWSPAGLRDQVGRAGERYPDADAVILSESMVITMDGEGLVSRRHHRVVVLFTDNSIRRYGDPRILYNTERQKLDISAARVYMRGGTAVDTEDNGFNLTTPFPFALAPDYTGWQEMVVTHVGIEKRCVAELDYTIRDKRRAAGWLSGVEHLAGEDPALLRTLEIRIPAGARLRHVSMNGAPEPESTQGGVFVWRMENTPGSASPGGGVWKGDCVPTVCYSTAEGWDEVLRHIAARIGEAASGSGSFQAAVEDAVKEARTDEERILNVHREALECVRGVEAPFALLAGRPRAAQRIYDSAYAHSLDRTVLLSAMLREAGFESVPVLAAQGKSWPGDIPAPELFGRILLEVFPGGSGDDGLLLDPGRPFVRDSRKSFSGAAVARCRDGGGIIHLPEREAGENISSLDLTLELDGEGGIEGEGMAVLTGIFSPYYSIRGVGNETETFIEGGVGGMFGGAVLESWNLNKLERERVEIGFRFKAEITGAKTGARIYLSIPRPLEAGASGVDDVHVERSVYQAPVRLMPCVLEVSCALEVPDGWKVAALPPRAGEKNSVGSISVDASPGTDGGANFDRRLVIDRDFISQDDYGMLRSLLLEFGEGCVILEKE